LVLAVLFAIGCHNGNSNNMDSPDMAVMPFQADSAAVYVAKVKDLLVGLPPTDAEVQAVTADPSALGGLIDGWMQLPQYQDKMVRFFQLAFQQTQITAADFIDMIPTNGLGKGTMIPLLVQNVQESFARTVVALIQSGTPLNQMVTTRQLMMTPPLMELYAFLDTHRADDNAKITDLFSTMTNKTPISFTSQGTAIPLSDSLDPANPNGNYMKFTDPGVATMMWPDPSCATDPLVYPAPISSYVLHDWILGTLSYNKFTSSTGFVCKMTNGKAMASPFTTADFSDWRMVTLRAPNAGETRTQFWDVPALRAANELVLDIPRLGFFSTPAFFANWPTNTSNQMRVTINQSLIVALGQAIDGTDNTTPSTTPGLDATHANPGGPCFACHQLLDPTRSILAATYSWAYSPQTDPMYSGQKGQFAFENVIQPVNSIDDFANTLSTHPLFASAWAQKLCYWANSAPCKSDDPEFTRIVGDFTNSSFNWSTLVKELLTSPITTNTTQTATTAVNGEVIAVARRDQLCQALDNRLGLKDICGLDLVSPKQLATTVPEIVGGLPSDGYGRGSTIPVLPNQPTLFYRAGVENICGAVAAQVIDGGVKKWSSTQPDQAIADFVSQMLGFTSSDPRSGSATQLLTAHFTQAQAAGQSASDALKSTFMVSCLSPSFIGIGM
jgi:hypothetical protein